MADLIKDFSIEGHNYTFLFRKVVSTSTHKYFIRAFNKIDEQVHFEMKRLENGRWVIIQPAPLWITQMEVALSEFISAHVTV
ncbi:MAG TPA: hypothetical protein VHK91_07035 [Flavisolibacter sp.]|jgi:hypothetical protein|nr:hypothetical protein [Flavisolibacter sp.]